MPNIAILIDAENVQPTYAEKIMTQAAALGSIVSKEIYGTAQALNNWVEPVLKYAFHPNLTIKASKGKNSSDIALVIGAMDLIAATPVETILLASSDSDFSALSVRLRSAGIHVVGMGTERSNPLWRTACSEFIVFNSVTAPRPAQSKEKPQQAPSKAKQAAAQGSQEAKPASAKQAAAPSTHTSRVAVIRSVIVNTLEAHQGRMPSSQLFEILNALPEYRQDQQRSRRKPLNYLTRQFSDVLQVEEGSEGTTVLTPTASGPAPQPAIEPAPPVPEEKGNEAPAAEETVPATAAPNAQREPTAEAPNEELAMLLSAGIPEQDAPRVAAILTESSSLRQAYNRLRSAFGTQEGANYYQMVKAFSATVH